MAVFHSNAHHSQAECCQTAFAASSLATDQGGQQQQAHHTHSVKVEQPQSAQNHGNHSYPDNTRPAVACSKDNCQEAMVAIAGHDPAVLEIWNMQVVC